MVQQPPWQHGPTAGGSLSHADSQPAPTAAPAPASAPTACTSQLPHFTQYPGQADHHVAAVDIAHCGSAPQACQPHLPALAPPVASAPAPAYWQHTGALQQAVRAPAAPALDWRGGSQEMAATQLQFSPKQEAQAGAACGAPWSPLQQVHSVGLSATYMHVGDPGPHGVCRQQWAAAAPPSPARAATGGTLHHGSRAAPATPPRLIRPPPVSPVSPPGSYGARMADQLRQATTLLRVHGGPVGGACHSPHSGSAAHAAGMAAEGGGLGESASGQHGRLGDGMAQEGGSSAGGCRSAQQDGGRSGLHDRGPLASGGRPVALHGQALGSVQAPTPARKRARTKAQRLQQLQEQGGGVIHDAAAAGLDAVRGCPWEAGGHAHEAVDCAAGVGAGGPPGAASLHPPQAARVGVPEAARGCSSRAHGVPDSTLHGLVDGKAGAVVDVEHNDDIQLVSMTPATHGTPRAAMDVIDLCGD